MRFLFFLFLFPLQASAIQGDINNDGVVDFTDFLILAQNFGKQGEPISGVRDTIRITIYDTIRVEPPLVSEPKPDSTNFLIGEWNFRSAQQISPGLIQQVFPGDTTGKMIVTESIIITTLFIPEDNGINQVTEQFGYELRLGEVDGEPGAAGEIYLTDSKTNEITHWVIVHGGTETPEEWLAFAAASGNTQSSWYRPNAKYSPPETPPTSQGVF